MSIAVMNLVWQKSRAKGGELLLMIALADAADDRGFCRPHVPTLAKKARMTDRNVQLTRKSLEENGELEVQIGAGRGGANVYRICLETLQAYPDDDETQLSSGEKISPSKGENSSPPNGEKISPGGEAHFTGGVKLPSPPSEPSLNQKNPLPPEPGGGEGEMVTLPELRSRLAAAFALTPAEIHRIDLGDERARLIGALQIDRTTLLQLERLWKKTNGESWGGQKVWHSTTLLKFLREPDSDITRARQLFPARKEPALPPVHRDVPLTDPEPSQEEKHARIHKLKAAVDPNYQLAANSICSEST